MVEYGMFEINKITLDAPSCSNCAFFGTDSNCEPECFLKKRSPERYEEFKGKKAPASMTSSPSIGLCAAWLEDEKRKKEIEKLPFTFSEDKKELIEVSEDFLENGKCLVIPYGTEIIRSDAFSNMENLEKVFIPRSVKEIESGAFCDCHKLMEIEIPDSVVNLGPGVFFCCSELRSVIFKNYQSAFSNLTGGLPGSQFGNLSGNPSENLSGSLAGGSDKRKVLSVLPYNIFGYCRKLSKIQLPPHLSTIDTDAFMGCTSLESLKLPDSVRTIKKGAFRWAEKLSQVNIPASLESLEEGSFVNTPLSDHCLSEWKKKFPDFKIEIDESED